MDKTLALGLIKLLSALESWGFSNKQSFPDYLIEDLCTYTEKLEVIILSEDRKNG